LLTELIPLSVEDVELIEVVEASRSFLVASEMEVEAKHEASDSSSTGIGDIVVVSRSFESEMSEASTFFALGSEKGGSAVIVVRPLKLKIKYERQSVFNRDTE
jgi:hypothetical protein